MTVGGAMGQHRESTVEKGRESVRLDAAANTLAPALAELRHMGFTVRKQGDSGYLAERPGLVLGGDDVLQLLALAVLSERRGDAACRASDAEIENLLALEKSAC